MTAEIAILNRSAVALAADSAVTIGKERVWKNSNKLFSLSSYNDIGVMIFGSGDYCGVAWEIVIKQFRKHLGKRVFEKLSDCENEFYQFISELVTPGQDISLLNIYYIFLRSIKECDPDDDRLKALDRRAKFLARADHLIKKQDDLPIILDGITKKDFSDSYGSIIRGFLKEVPGLHVTNPIYSKIVTLCFERFRRQFESSFETGVVFAGYGEKEILPSIHQWVVDGKHGSRARAWVERRHDLNSDSSPSAFVIPFAQTDIAYLFMEGMQLDYLSFIEETARGILDEKSERLVAEYVPSESRVVEKAKQSADNEIVVTKFMEQFQKMRRDEAIQPMLRVVSSLPKEEMAAMAEALVEITSLRRKIDSKLESVGGPVDVAVISKSDGFIWIKRKHYFDVDLNPDFMIRRAIRFEGGSR